MIFIKTNDLLNKICSQNLKIEVFIQGGCRKTIRNLYVCVFLCIFWFSGCFYLNIWFFNYKTMFFASSTKYTSERLWNYFIFLFWTEACEIGRKVGNRTCPSCPKTSKWGRNLSERQPPFSTWILNTINHFAPLCMEVQQK